MNTYHHLSPHSGQLISNVYEFAEKELKNKGDSVYNYKNYLLNQQVKVLIESGTHLNLQDYQPQGLAMAVMIKTLDWKGTDNFFIALLMDISRSIFREKAFFRHEIQPGSYLKVVKGQGFNDEQWLDCLSDLLRGHRYFSAYGQHRFMPGLKRNLRNLDKMIK